MRIALELTFALPLHSAGQATAPAEFARGYAATVATQSSQPGSRRLRRLFELRWRQQMTDSPESATYVGFPGQNGRWTDLSPAAIERRKRALGVPLRAIRSIDRARLGA